MIERTPHHARRMPLHPAAPMAHRVLRQRPNAVVHPVAQMHRARRPVARIATPAPISSPFAAAPLSGYDGLGFSLKPPKAIRKAATAIKKAVTIKNVAKAAAVVGAAALVPGLLPAVAKGALAVGKAAVGGGKLLGKGAVAAERAVVRNVTGAARVFKPQPPRGTVDNKNNPAPTQPTGDALPPVATTTPSDAPIGQPAPPPVAPADVFGPDGASPSGGPTASGAGMTPATSDDSAAATRPSQSGFGGMAPLAIAGVAAVLLLARKPRRARRR